MFLANRPELILPFSQSRGYEQWTMSNLSAYGWWEETERPTRRLVAPMLNLANPKARCLGNRDLN